MIQGALSATRLKRRTLRWQLHREMRRWQLVRAAAVGACAGLLGVAYQTCVAGVESLSHAAGAGALRSGAFALVAFLVAGGLLGALAAWGTGAIMPESGGSGIPHVKAVLMNLRTLRPGVLLPWKFFGGLLALASGMSLGREGPTIQMGAAVGKLFGSGLKLSRRSQNPLIAAGAGAGLAAAFNAPLAGFLFVMEELKREMSPLTYGTALVGSVCAVAAERMVLGQYSSFRLPNPGVVRLVALPAVLITGMLCGAMGVGFNKALIGALELRERLKIPRWSAGAVVGVVASMCLLWAPNVAGGGHAVAEGILRGEFRPEHVALFAFLVCVGKLFLTAGSYGTGVPGGIFAPILVMGACLGYSLGFVLHDAMPWANIDPRIFATIGMASLLSGSVRAPLTGVVLIIEMTSEYQLLYVLLIGSFAAHLIAEALRDRPVYEHLLERDLHRGGEVGAPTTPSVIELFIEPDSDLDGRRIIDVGFPPSALVVGVEREGGTIVPRGGTRLMAGDHLTIVLSGETSTEDAVCIHDAAKAP